jgi:hypothetical protein
MAAVVFASVAAQGQGQFLFNTHDPTAGNVLTFYGPDCVTLASGPDLFVEVLAGPDANSLVRLAPLLSLNRTGAGAGFTNPFSEIYTVPGMVGGSSAVVGYREFQGTSYATATFKIGLGLATAPVVLTEPPTPPNEVALGTHFVTNLCPEPPTWTAGLLGVAIILLFRFQKRRMPGNQTITFSDKVRD